MQFLPWRPVRLLVDLDRAIDESFAELIERPWGVAAQPSWQPAIDLHETDDAYVLEGDLPGVDPDKVELRVGEHSVTLSGERRFATRELSMHSVRLERGRGRFSRTIYLEHAIDPARVETRCEHGIFVVRLPKKRPAT